MSESTLKTGQEKSGATQIYESNDSASQYSEFHFGDTYYNVQNFPQILAQKSIAIAQENKKSNKLALDLGCAVGRSTFDLALHFDKVIGIDYSHKFVEVCNQMKNNKQLQYFIQTEGDLGKLETRTLKELGLDQITEKVEFAQGDACDLDAKFTNFDLILAANLIDRLYKPTLFLNSIHERINKGGLLVLTSPYTWIDEYTPKENWIGGYKDAETGKDVNTLDGLKDYLGKNFNFLDQYTQDVEFVIRETARKFQHSKANFTVWERK